MRAQGVGEYFQKNKAGSIRSPPVLSALFRKSLDQNFMDTAESTQENMHMHIRRICIIISMVRPVFFMTFSNRQN